MQGQSAGLEALGRDLGEQIAESDVHQAFEEAKAAVETDPEVQERIREFETLRQEFTRKRERGEATEADLSELKRAQEDLHSMPEMAEYLDAQERLQERLAAVNDAISAELAVDFGGEAGGCCRD
jgi:cell fate (sporulation/competence/biofilm development) regulator YlbF (YheA/YmcA/DUF963 family)